MWLLVNCLSFKGIPQCDPDNAHACGGMWKHDSLAEGHQPHLGNCSKTSDHNDAVAGRLLLQGSGPCSARALRINAAADCRHRPDGRSGTKFRVQLVRVPELHAQRGQQLRRHQRLEGNGEGAEQGDQTQVSLSIRIKSNGSIGTKDHELKVQGLGCFGWVRKIANRMCASVPMVLSGSINCLQFEGISVNKHELAAAFSGGTR